MKRVVSKYFSFFLAYSFWFLVLLILGTAFRFPAEQEKFTLQTGYTMSSSEKGLEMHRATVFRIFSNVLLRELTNSWYYPLALTLGTICIVESLPKHKVEEA
jgi:ABC-type transport system involved in multi-copper enzyme maturation permease subunit